MCINFIPPSAEQLHQHFKVKLAAPDTWPAETWQDYAAPIILSTNNQPEAVLASYGMVPKAHLPKGVRLSTMNARAETVGELKSYRYAWQNLQLCLVPMLGFFEPCYESGKAERWQIKMADDKPFAVAGLWRTWQDDTGAISHAFTQITMNADHHPLMKRMHKPADEKRSLVVVRPEEYDAWLSCRHPDEARSFIRDFPATDMQAFYSPKAKVAPASSNFSLF